jgi:hypothetical protein
LDAIKVKIIIEDSRGKKKKIERIKEYQKGSPLYEAF